MDLLTARVSVTIPSDEKARLIAAGRSRGMSLGALMRAITADLIDGSRECASGKVPTR